MLDLLVTEEDRLTRAAVDEFVARGERMLDPLTRILQSEEDWDQEGPGFWRPVHAAFILGALGGEKAIPGLLAAQRHADAFDVDWVSEALPDMMAAIGLPAIDPLWHRFETADAESHERFDCLIGLARIAARNPDRRTEILNRLHSIGSDTNEVQEARLWAGCELLDFARPEDRDLLEELARIAMAAGPYRLVFDLKDVEKAYGPTPGKPSWIRPHWLEFYDAPEIEERQARWRKEDAESRLAEADRYGPIDGPLDLDVAVPPTAGRNDPCPCGSGKKFKKCCG